MKKITQFLAVFPLILFVIIEITIIKNSIDSVKLKNEIPRKIPKNAGKHVGNAKKNARECQKQCEQILAKMLRNAKKKWKLPRKMLKTIRKSSLNSHVVDPNISDFA